MFLKKKIQKTSADENNNEISTPNSNDSQGKNLMDHRMNDRIPKSLDEDDMKDVLPEGLYLLRLEDACTRKYFDSILAKQIQLLQQFLTKSKAQNQLVVANTRQKQKQNAQQESKKRGRKSTLQRINRLGTTLVESDQYAQLKESFSSPSVVNQ